MNSMPFHEQAEVRFAVMVRLHRHAAPGDEVDFQRRTEDWLNRHELRAEGSQTAFVVLADRDLAPIDQANALLAMLDDHAVRHARVGPIVVDGDELSAKVTGSIWVEADRYDPLVFAARTLYEAGRLDGRGFLDALGGYVFRPAEHADEPVEGQP